MYKFFIKYPKKIWYFNDILLSLPQYLPILFR